MESESVEVRMVITSLSLKAPIATWLSCWWVSDATSCLHFLLVRDFSATCPSCLCVNDATSCLHFLLVKDFSIRLLKYEGASHHQIVNRAPFSTVDTRESCQSIQSKKEINDNLISSRSFLFEKNSSWKSDQSWYMLLSNAELA